MSPNVMISIGTIGLIKNEILMHLRSLRKMRKDVSLHEPIVTDKEGNDITLIDILGTEIDEVVDMVQLKTEKSIIYKKHDLADNREKEVVVGRCGWSTAARCGRRGRSRRSRASHGARPYGSRSGR